ncbi:MAG: TetR/AcrR family transcriptional regulator [Gemmatimonadota bacterium]
MPEAVKSLHVRQKRQKRRAEIVHAALSAFREHGFHATSLDDIANRLGIRKAALYHYFTDKDTLLFECHRESLAELDRIILLSARPGQGPAERLAYLLSEHVRIMTDTLEGSPLAFEVPALPPVLRAPIVAGRDRYERKLRELVAAGIAAGEFRAVDPKVVVFAMLGSINWIARWYRPDGQIKGDDLGQHFADYLIRGLR